MSVSMFAGPAIEIPRDRWGRPFIEPVDGGKAIAYTRASTMAKELGDKSALTKWMQRQVLVGVSIRPELVDMAREVAGDDKAIGAFVERAMEAAKTKRAADVGTEMHRLTEFIDAGVPVETIEPSSSVELPAGWRMDLAAYKKAMAPIGVVGSEVFVVTDEIRCAGTFDRLVALPDGRVMVGDIKTGATEPDYPQSSAIQMAIYAHGWTYEHERGRIESLADLGVSQTEGLMIHLPAGRGTCDLYVVNLEVGWGLARTAYEVRSVYRKKAQFISALDL